MKLRDFQVGGIKLVQYSLWFPLLVLFKLGKGLRNLWVVPKYEDDLRDARLERSTHNVLKSSSA